MSEDELTEPDSMGGATERFPDGEIARRLKALQDHTEAPDPLDPLRKAAAVLTYFDPFELQTANGSKSEKCDRLDLLPELVRAPPPFSEAGLWTLPDGRRQEMLKELGSIDAIRVALEANPSRLKDPVQKMFERVLELGRSPDLTECFEEELRALSTVVRWLEGIIPSLPMQSELERLLERERELATLKDLADKHFQGRSNELKQLERHTSSWEPEVLFISGGGGSGKSTLVSKFLLDRIGDEGPDLPPDSKRFSWIRVDLDHPACDAQRPASTILLAIEQLGRRLPKIKKYGEQISLEISAQLRSEDQGQLESARTAEHTETLASSLFVNLFENTLGTGRHSPPMFPVVLVIDTFEEAQFFGREVEERFLGLFSRLALLIPKLRIIICGRTKPRVDVHEGKILPPIELSELLPEDGARLLHNLIQEDDPNLELEAPRTQRATFTGAN